MPQIVNKKSVLEMAMGAIAEITDYEVERVVANIMDPNTNATAKNREGPTGVVSMRYKRGYCRKLTHYTRFVRCRKAGSTAARR